MSLLNYYQHPNHCHQSKYFCHDKMPNSRKRHYSPSRSGSSDHSNEHDSENKRKKYDEKSHDEGHRNKSNDNYSRKGSLSFEREVENRSTGEENLQDIKSTSPVANIESQNAECVVNESNTKVELDSDGKTGISESIIEDHTKSIEQYEAENITEDDGNEVKNEDCSIHVDDSNSSAVTTTEKIEGVVSDDVECMVVDDDQNKTEGTTSKSKEEPQDLDKSTPGDDKTEVKSAITPFTTPKKILTPKKLQQKLESEKKRLERQKEKEEREKKKNAEKERIFQEKQRRKEEKQKEIELKQKEKEMKEEQKKKEKEEKDEQRRKEKEEKELKRKEKEEKEEMKRKEKEQEKIKKQQEIDERNKEKLKEEEKKKKTAALFVNFFVPTKAVGQEERKLEPTTESNFMAFEVKSDMRLPPPRRDSLTDAEKESLDNFIKEPNEEISYLKDLKKIGIIRKCKKTWPYEESVDDDVILVDLGETICEDKSPLQKFRAKFFKFHENRRPAYFGTWRKKSKSIKARRPLSTDNKLLNYEEDSDDDWEEEEQGESLNGSEDEAEKENEDEKDDYEVDNDFFVPHGHLSDDEVDDEENARLSPESMKQKLKLLKEEFDQDMKSKTNKLKPRSVGCIWYDEDGSNVDEAVNKYLQPLAIISNGQILIKKRSEIHVNQKYRKVSKELEPEHVPIFLKIVQGNLNKKSVVVEQFLQHMEKNGFTVMTSKAYLIKKLKQMATWKRCTDNGPLKNKFGWFVKDIEKLAEER